MQGCWNWVGTGGCCGIRIELAIRSLPSMFCLEYSGAHYSCLEEGASVWI